MTFTLNVYRDTGNLRGKPVTRVGNYTQMKSQEANIASAAKEDVNEVSMMEQSRKTKTE